MTAAAWTRIDSIRAEGPACFGMRLRIEVPDLRRMDLSNFLPLWGRAVSGPRAGRMWMRLEEGADFDTASGLRFAPAADPGAGRGASGDVWMFWNMLMGEAAVRAGKAGLAHGWIEKWMRTLAESLRADRSFRSRYEPDRPGGSGPRNSLQGIFPVGLFLSALGVRPVAFNRVWVGGRSIFPFPVTVRWRGMTIRREADSAQVDFLSGRRYEYQGAERMMIVDES
jgi:hypothetical protein